MTTDTECLLTAIESSPEDDALRLAYADALDEDEANNPRRVMCGKCQDGKEWRDGRSVLFKCSHCDGTGEVLDTTRSARARLIRIQCGDWHLGVEETAILREHETAFRRGPKCDNCEGMGYGYLWPEGTYKRENSRWDCTKCDGTGDLGGLMLTDYDYEHYNQTGITTKEPRHKIEWVRGFPRVHCRMEECISPNYMSNKPEMYKPSDWLISVVRHHWGVEVWVTDKLTDGFSRVWDSIEEPQLENIPKGIYEVLSRVHSELIDASYPNCMQFSTNVEARVALARAIPQWARGYTK